MKLACYGIAIAVVAYTALAVTHTTSAVQALIALPGAAGLLVAIWGLLKANLEHQHRLEEKSAENAFHLCATSHMAQKAFDKHVEFCEKYVARVNDALLTLFRLGPSQEAWKIADDLHQIRLEFALWETNDVASPLERFEHALCMIGIDKTSLPDVVDDDERAALIHGMYATFKEVMSLEALPDKPTPEIAISRIIARLQEHVGISKLTELRKHILTEAGRRIK